MIYKIINKVAFLKKRKSDFPLSFLLRYPKYVEDARKEAGEVSVELSRESFEKYFNETKPFLNPKLRMEDLLQDLKTNRSYLSEFINKTYRMGFRNFVNNCRIAEYKRLVADPENQSLSNLELVLMAGFGSYRNFLRVQKKELEKTDNSALCL